MLPYLYIFPIKEKKTQKYLDYLNNYISQILEHIYGGSSSKFICICGITFYVYRLSNTGSRIVGMDKYTKNQNIYSCLSGDHMCVLECIYISVHNEEYKKQKGIVKNIVPKLKQFYRELFDKPFPEKFEGLDIMKTLELAAKKYNVKFIIYHHDDNERLDHLNTIGESENKHNLLMISGKSDNTSNNPSNNISENVAENIIVHVMYIKNIQKYTKLHICPKCGTYLQLLIINLLIKTDLKTMLKTVMEI
jgi:hypothetical protein